MNWVDFKKGTKVRTRLVVREIRTRKKEHERPGPSVVFASMPPVEAVKALISHMQTEQMNSKGEHLEIMCLDVSRAADAALERLEGADIERQEMFLAMS